MPRRVPDISKVRTLIGFRPTMKLDEIIRSVIETMRTGTSASVPGARRSSRARRQRSPSHVS